MGVTLLTLGIVFSIPLLAILVKSDIGQAIAERPRATQRELPRERLAP